MSTTPRRALIVIDVQNEYFDGGLPIAHPPVSQSLPNILRAMGATNALAERRRTFTRRATLLRMAEIYRQRFSDPDGRIRATFEIIWISGWAPHESQQKPLRPGSAKARLADALGTLEHRPKAE